MRVIGRLGSTKAQGGLGIGLTLVKNFVEMQNGMSEAGFNHQLVKRPEPKAIEAILAYLKR